MYLLSSDSVSKKILLALISTIAGLALYACWLVWASPAGDINRIVGWLLILYFIPGIASILIAGRFVRGLNTENNRPPYRIARWCWFLTGVLVLLSALLKYWPVNDFTAFFALLAAWCVAMLMYCFAMNKL